MLDQDIAKANGLTPKDKALYDGIWWDISKGKGQESLERRLAIFDGDKESIQHILNAVNDSGQTLLFRAAVKKLVEAEPLAIHWLLNKGANVDVRDNGGNALLYDAMCSWNQLRIDGEGRLRGMNDSFGYSVYSDDAREKATHEHRQKMLKRQEIVQLLVQHSNDLEVSAKYGGMPLSLVAEDIKNVPVVTCFLARLNTIYGGEEDWSLLRQAVYCWRVVAESAESAESPESVLRYQIASYKAAIELLFANRDNIEGFDEDAWQVYQESFKREDVDIVWFLLGKLQSAGIVSYESREQPLPVISEEDDRANQRFDLQPRQPSDEDASVLPEDKHVPQPLNKPKRITSFFKTLGYGVLLPLVGLIILLLWATGKGQFKKNGAAELPSSPVRSQGGLDENMPKVKEKKTLWCQYTSAFDALFSRQKSEEKVKRSSHQLK